MRTPRRWPSGRDAGGYDIEVTWDVCTTAALGVCLRPGEVPRADHAVRRRAEAAGAGVPAARARRGAAARRAGQLPRRAGQALARGADPRVRRRRSCSSATTASCWTTPPPGWSRSSSVRPATRCGRTRAASRRTTRPAGTASRASRSCAGAGTRSTPSSRRWCCATSIKAEYNDGMASQYQAAQTRLRKFEEAGPPHGAAARAAGDDAAPRRPHRQAGRGLRAAWS